MKKTFLLALSLSFSALSQAACIEDFRMLQNKKQVSLVPVRAIELTTNADYKKLTTFESKAVKDYVAYVEYENYGENFLEVTTEMYVKKSSREILGYKVSVTDGGDESNVRYYVKNATNFPILYRMWDNQSPEYTWICR
jgi:hypothetical protein